MNKKDNSNFKIYRLCRDQKEIERLAKEAEKYNLPQSILVTGPDYFTFLRDLIKECKEDFALVCHDDVVLPLDINERVAASIKNANDRWGSRKWGLIGNAGIEAISLKTLRFLKDPHSAVIPYNLCAAPAVSVDGNTMLLNIKNIRDNKVQLPDLKGFHLYDLIMGVECYDKNLLVLIDSELYVYHKSGGAQKGFDEFSKSNNFQGYWLGKFINHKIYTINGPIEIRRKNLDYLKEQKTSSVDYYGLVKKIILDTSRIKPTVNIITRTQYKNINMLKRLITSVQVAQSLNKEYLNINLILSVNNPLVSNPERVGQTITKDFPGLSIDFVYGKGNLGLAPRVEAIKDAVEKVNTGASEYVWIVDDDDFIFPKDLKLITHYLDSETLFVGNSESFDETWKPGDSLPEKSSAKPIFYSESCYAKNYLGDNRVPVCSVIFPAEILKTALRENDLLGDYYEDYALIFLSQSKHNIQYLPVLIAGVSHHDKNTIFVKDRTHWDYSYTTFMSEMVNKGTVTNSQYELVSIMENYEKNYRSIRHLFSIALNKAKHMFSLLLRLKIRTFIYTLRNHL